MIPKIINFVSRDYTNLNILQKYCINRWKNLHTGYKFYFYDDLSGLKVLSKYYPQHIDLYKESPGIIKSQIIRYLITYIYGGTYVDTDVCPFIPLDHWITNNDTLITVSSASVEHDFQFHTEAGHDFFDQMLNQSFNRWSDAKHQWLESPTTVEDNNQNMGLLFSCCGVSLFHGLSQSYQRRILTEPYCDQHRFPWQHEIIPKKNAYYTFHYSLGSWCKSGRSFDYAKTFIENTNKYF